MNIHHVPSKVKTILSKLFQVDIEGKPISNQKSSSRCWIFAAMNAIRIPFMKLYNIEEFEFSQAYLFFWDKVERSNNFLNNVVETALRGEDVNGRLLSFLLKVSAGRMEKYKNTEIENFKFLESHR